MMMLLNDYGQVALDDWREGCFGGVELSLIAPVAPLDAQFGSFPLRDTPLALDAAVASSSGLYAVLDAALVPGCEEYLAVSGCSYDCLFRGDARAEWGAAGPWLVALPRGHRLRRMLFTQIDPAPPWQLWHRFPGLLIATDAGFGAVLAHLRRFTRLRAPDGDWFYFRFWERHVLGTLAMTEDPLAEALLAKIDGAAATWIVPDPPASRALLARLAANRADVPTPRPALTAQTLAALDAATARRLARAEVAGALRGMPPERVAQWLHDPRLLDLRAQLIALRVTQPEDRRDAIALYLQAHDAGSAAEAWQALTAPGVGAGVRLWRLRQMLGLLEITT
jgi:hypothetical protein